MKYREPRRCAKLVCEAVVTWVTWLKEDHLRKVTIIVVAGERFCEEVVSRDLGNHPNKSLLSSVIPLGQT